MLHSYYSNISSQEHFKKKFPSNSVSKSQIVTRSKTTGNHKNQFLTKKLTSPQKKNNNDKSKNNSNKKLNQSYINKHIQYKKKASANYIINRTLGSINNNNNNSNSFIKTNDGNKTVFISQEKNKILTNSQSNKDYNAKKKKILTVNTDNSHFTNESFGMNTITENNNNNGSNDKEIVKKFKSTLLNSGSMFNIHNNSLKKEQPLKLYNENITHNNNLSNYQTENNNSLKFTRVNTNNNSLSNSISLNNYNTNKNTFNILGREQFSKQINDIDIILENNLNENKSNSKSKKYNIIKHAFEDLLRLLQNNNSKVNNTNLINLLQKLLYGYHEVVNAFSIENRELKQLNFSLNEKNEKMDKLLLESMSVMNEKNRELKFLKKKISTISLETDANTNHITSNENENLNIKTFEKGSINEKIFNLNKNNLDDLDALYFFDKIEMKNKRSNSQTVPLIKIGKEELKKLNRNDKNKEKIIHHIYNKSENNMNDNYKKNFSNFKMVKSQFKI